MATDDDVERPRPIGDAKSESLGVDASASRHVAERKTWLWRMTRLDYPIELIALAVIIVVTLIANIVSKV